MHIPYRFSEGRGSGSASFGFDYHGMGRTTILVIVNRWHEFTRHGTTLVTLMVGEYADNIDAVDDGFGNLVLLNQHSQFHRTSPRDD